MKTILLRTGALAALLFIAISVCSAPVPLPSFTKITSGPVVSAGTSSSLAWGDYNNDGFIDLYVNVLSGSSLLYSNNGNGTFTRVTTGPVATDVNRAFGAAWGDYDNDGALDLFVATSNLGNDWLYRNNGNGTFTKIATGAIVSSGGNGNNCSWGDYDNDGFIDLWVANSDQRDFLYHNNGDGTFARITNGPIAQKEGNSQGGSWGDYDNDGRLDLFVSRVNEPNLLYHNEGNGAFRAITNGIMVTEQTISQGTSWGDYDNDGYLDLFVANPVNGLKNFLYHNNGDGTFTKIIDGPVVADSFGSGGAWADYDNDGFLDLFVANRVGLLNSLFHNNGDGTFSKITNVVPATDPNNSFSAAWADYDNDGFPDLFVSSINTYNNSLYHNNGNANNWLTIKCEGRMSNRASIGAKVRLRATIGGRSFWQLREISGGGGLGSQNDLRAQFGLGDATMAERVRIEWPSGIVQELNDVPAKQFLTIVEPELSISPKEQQPLPGDTATFTFLTTIEPPVTLQWQLDGGDVVGATNATLVITNVQSHDAGLYTVRLTTADGLVLRSPGARLNGPVFFTQQPQSQNARAGSNVTFQATVTGIAPFSYQWQRNGNDIAGETQSALTLTNLQLSDTAEYRVVVSNVFGAAISAPATLIVLVRPVLVEQPQSQTVVAGDDVTLSVSAYGTLPMNFSWRLNGSVVTNILLNQTNCSWALRQVRTNQAGIYRVGITNLAGAATQLSSNAVLTVLADTDGDHIPDEWELAHGLDVNSAADAGLDNDSDGLTNLQEYLAGTDPNDASSRLRITSCYLASEASLVRLQFAAMSNRLYRVEFRNEGSASDWTRLTDVPTASTNRTVTVEDGTSPDRLRLYRVKVQR